jgi:cell division ATPase FtsA
MGASTTKMSLVGNHSIFISKLFMLGGNDLAMKISERFNIGENEAVELMETYGLNNRTLEIEPTICESMDEFGQSVSFTPSHLNEIIKDFMENNYFKQLDVALEQLLVGYGDDIRRLPIVFTVGFSKLNGFKELAEAKFTKNQQLFYFSPSAIGARDPKFAACVGALVSSSKYKGTLSDARAKVTKIERVNTKE